VQGEQQAFVDGVYNPHDRGVEHIKMSWSPNRESFFLMVPR